MTRFSAVSTQHQCERLAAQRRLGVHGLVAGGVGESCHAKMLFLRRAGLMLDYARKGAREGAWR